MASPGIQRFLIQRDNACAGATVSASAVKAASNTIFNETPTRAGNSTGRVTLSGSYTGANDKTIDVEILGSTGSTALISKPVFSGVGNGTIENVSASTASTQNIALTLVDLGQDTIAAELDFYGVKLQAKTPGADGNDIYLSVDRSGISLSSSPLAYLTADINSTHVAQVGPQWDWGGLSLDSDGGIKPSSPRIAIGMDYPVYRAYRTYENGDWNYHISPAPVASHPKNTPVWTVSGTYTVTVSDGVTTENYTGITTLFDLLTAIRGRSELIEVIGVVSDDRAPGGMGSRELPLQTDAYAWPVEIEGSEYVTNLEISSIDPGAASQQLEIECIDDRTTGRERWSVRSSALGVLNEAITGVLYPDSTSPAIFTIPQKLPSTAITKGRIGITGYTWATREDGQGYPDICLYRPVIGARAENQTLRLRWTQRPAEECNCENATVSGAPDPDCLGISEVPGETAVALDTEYQTRLNSLYSWRKTAARANTEIDSARLRSAVNDLNLLDRVTAIFAAPLAEGSYKTTAANTEWDARFSAMQTDLTALMADIAGIPLEGTYPTYYPDMTLADGGLLQPPPSQANGHYYSADIKSVTTKPAITNADLQVASWPTDGGTILVYTSVEWDDTDLTYKGVPTLLRDRGPVDTTDDVTYIESSSDAIRHDVNNFCRRYAAEMDYVRALAGIVPKGDAGAGETSQCWSDPGDAYYWEIVGTDYLPVFNNLYYHSARALQDGNGNTSIVSTQEFGFTIRVGCPERLIEGDEVTIVIADVVSNKTYKEGDKFTLPIVAASNEYLTGGVDGDDTHTWSVVGSVDGPLADYAVINGSEVAYAVGGLTFTIYRGDVANALGDKWAFSISRNQFQWREDGGSYSAAIDVSASPILLTDGISANFVVGKDTSYDENDLFSFTIKQPYSPGNAILASDALWHPDSAAASITLDFGSNYSIELIAIPWHALPDTATITWELQDAASATLDSGAMAWSRGVITAKPSSAVTARKLVITLSSAADGAIRWIWAGAGLGVSWDATECRITPEWKTTQEAVTQSKKFLGRGFSASVAWAEAGLEYSDADSIYALFDSLKSNDNQPVVLVPNYEHSTEAYLHRLSSDSLEMFEPATDYAALPSDTVNSGDRVLSLRRLNARLELGAVYF